MTALVPGFLWGASTAPHQVEGDNVNSDRSAREQFVPGTERSGDAVDRCHRYDEDMRLLADAGLNAYRFGIEWARIEPGPGHFSKAELACYRRMIDKAFDNELTPVLTLHHFSEPRWFTEEGGWMSDRAIKRFEDYVGAVTAILDGIEWVCTMNEPNTFSLMAGMNRGTRSAEPQKWATSTVVGGVHPVLPGPEVGMRLAAAHHAAREIIRNNTGAKVGWTVTDQAPIPAPGNDNTRGEPLWAGEDLFLEVARDDDFIGVQSCGIVPSSPAPNNTRTGNAYRPDALSIAVRRAWEATGGVPILITEHGIATTDDTQRVTYTSAALRHLFTAIDDGIDVRGYLHRSALDNLERGHGEPTFGLIAVDRDTFARKPKPSLYWLGDVARRGHP